MLHDVQTEMMRKKEQNQIVDHNTLERMKALEAYLNPGVGFDPDKKIHNRIRGVISQQVSRISEIKTTEDFKKAAANCLRALRTPELHLKKRYMPRLMFRIINVLFFGLLLRNERIREWVQQYEEVQKQKNIDTILTDMEDLLARGYTVGQEIIYREEALKRLKSYEPGMASKPVLGKPEREAENGLTTNIIADVEPRILRSQSLVDIHKKEKQNQ
jgi:hypothetical protein